PQPVAEAGKPDVPAALQKLFSPREREKSPQRKAHDLLEGPKAERLQEKGVDTVLDYGALLLRARRLPEAEAFFQKLGQDSKQTAYRWIVDLGQAMVLAQRDKPAESNRLFRSTLDNIERIEKLIATAAEPKKGRIGQLRHWERNLDWREQMAAAL